MKQFGKESKLAVAGQANGHTNNSQGVGAFSPSGSNAKPNTSKKDERKIQGRDAETDSLEERLPAANLLRLFVKKGEYIYARPSDIILLESCDHLVKVHLSCRNKTKIAIRSSTLKDFLLQLPANLFLRINRFCAVNSERLSGGNYNEQIFEFDFSITVRPRHGVSQAVFNAIGK